MVGASRILVVDGDPARRRGIVEMLTAAGHETLEAQDGLEGLDVFRAQGARLVITAIVMPRMDGFETMRELRAEAQAVAIIAISNAEGTRGPLYFNLAKMLGADEAIAEPFSAAQLMEAVDRLT